MEFHSLAKTFISKPGAGSVALVRVRHEALAVVGPGVRLRRSSNAGFARLSHARRNTLHNLSSVNHPHDSALKIVFQNVARDSAS